MKLLPSPLTNEDVYLLDIAESLRDIRAILSSFRSGGEGASNPLPNESLMRPIPGGFPHKDELTKDGYIYLELVPRWEKELVKIPGIGVSRAKEIRAELGAYGLYA